MFRDESKIIRKPQTQPSLSISAQHRSDVFSDFLASQNITQHLTALIVLIKNKMQQYKDERSTYCKGEMFISYTPLGTEIDNEDNYFTTCGFKRPPDKLTASVRDKLFQVGSYYEGLVNTELGKCIDICQTHKRMPATYLNLLGRSSQLMHQHVLYDSLGQLETLALAMIKSSNKLLGKTETSHGSPTVVQMHRESFDKARLEQALAFRKIARLILHLKARHSISNSSSSNSILLFSKKTHTTSKYLLTQTQLHLAVRELLNYLRNTLMTKRDEQDITSLYQPHEARQLGFNFIRLIMITGLRHLLSGKELFELVGILIEALEPALPNQLTRHLERATELIPTLSETQYFKIHLHYFAELKHSSSFIESIAAHFSNANLSVVLLNDDELAKNLFICLFDYKNYPFGSENLPVQTMSLISLLLPLEDLLAICEKYLLDEHTHEIFNRAYNYMTGGAFVVHDSIEWDDQNLDAHLNENELRRSFSQQIRQHHPDKNSADDSVQKLYLARMNYEQAKNIHLAKHSISQKEETKIRLKY